MHIEIVIPILNEQESLERQVLFLIKHLEDSEYSRHRFTITIADNGSSDRSGEIGLKLSNSIAGVSYLRTDKKGVGLALKTAWLNSEAEVIGFMDLDFATNLNHLKEVWKSLEYDGFEIVCGSRNLPTSIVTNRKVSRTITSKALNAIIRTVFKTKFTDGMCGFKFLHKRNLPIILKNGLGFDGWFFSTEILIVAEYAGLPIHDLAVNWSDNRHSKVKIARLSIRYLSEIYRLKIHFVKNLRGVNTFGSLK